MTRVNHISEIDNFHPTVEQAEKAFDELIKRDFTMHVPPEFEDADIVMSRVVEEWKEYKRKEGERMSSEFFDFCIYAHAECDYWEDPNLVIETVRSTVQRHIDKSNDWIRHNWNTVHPNPTITTDDVIGEIEAVSPIRVLSMEFGGMYKVQPPEHHYLRMKDCSVSVKSRPRIPEHYTWGSTLPSQGW